MIGFLVLFAFAFAFLSITTIPEGNVGVIYRGGKLLDYYKEPGWNWVIPFIDRIEIVQIR